MKRSRLKRPEEIRVLIEPVPAGAAEYEQAWINALEVICRLSRGRKLYSPRHPT